MVRMLVVRNAYTSLLWAVRVMQRAMRKWLVRVRQERMDQEEREEEERRNRPQVRMDFLQ